MGAKRGAMRVEQELLDAATAKVREEAEDEERSDRSVTLVSMCSMEGEACRDGQADVEQRVEDHVGAGTAKATCAPLVTRAATMR
jgi:hypothetical protein